MNKHQETYYDRVKKAYYEDRNFDLFTEEVYLLYSEGFTVRIMDRGSIILTRPSHWGPSPDRSAQPKYCCLDFQILQEDSLEIPEPYLSRLLSMEAERTPRGVVGH